MSKSNKSIDMFFEKIHHVAIICSDYQRSKHFYSVILALPIIRETFRPTRKSYKLDLQLSGSCQIELFSFPDAPKRPTMPEAQGLRHLSFAVSDIVQTLAYLKGHGVDAEPVRIDDLTNKRFTFFRDPDDLPLEIYEC